MTMDTIEPFIFFPPFWQESPPPVNLISTRSGRLVGMKVEIYGSIGHVSALHPVGTQYTFTRVDSSDVHV